MVADGWVAQTLRDFGLSMGLTRFHVNDKGVACVHITGIGSLFVEPRDDETVVVYLARELQRVTMQELEHALGLVYPLEGHDTSFSGASVWCGLRKDSQLIFGLRLGKGDFDSSSLERSITFLRNLHERVRP